MRIASCNVTGARGCRWSGCELRRLGWSKRWVLVTSGGGTGGGGGIGGGISYLRGQRLGSTVFPTPGSPTTTFDLLAPFRGALLRLSGLHLAVRRRKGLGREPIGRSAAVVVSGRAGGKREAGWRHADSAPMLTMDRAAKGRVGRTVKSERGAGFKGVCACVGGCVCGGGAGAYMLS